jgi:hypothetical protein
MHGASMPFVGVVPDGHGASIEKNIDLIDKIFF